jgi:hypothetical protein
MGKTPCFNDRLWGLGHWQGRKMIAIEPVLDFDLFPMFQGIKDVLPEQVNIGADSGRNGLPEPPREKIEELIELLVPFTKVILKKNLRRLLPEHRLYENMSRNLPVSTAKGGLNGKA